MCGDEDDLPGDGMSAADLHGGPARPLPTRRGVLGRGVLGGLAALTGAALFPARGAGAAPAAAAGSFTGFSPVRAAMHVHGSWSEGLGSWEQQFTNASELVDLMFMTDHDFRARANGYLTSLQDIPMVETRTGKARQQALTRSGVSVRLAVESAGSAPATVGCAVQEKPTGWNRLRTSIAGHTIVHTFGTTRLTHGARYEVVVQLSLHPAYGRRPAGHFELRYRFRQGAAARALENGGLTGVVAAPVPAAGTVVTLDLTRDVAALWPDMLARDNCFGGLALVVTSPLKGAVADVAVKDLRIHRAENDEASVVRNQQEVLRTYGPRFPGLVVSTGVELSRSHPHVNLLGVSPRFPDQRGFTPGTAYRRMIADTHALGGVASYNHAFGSSGGPRLAPEAAAQKRREVFAAMLADGLYGADVLEVAYEVRGGVDNEEHLRLWDTFSRRGLFLTGNGANDDHSGQPWAVPGNGFQTGIWAPSTGTPDVMDALRAGRAYAQHPGYWPGGQLDVLVDGALPMGAVQVRSTRSRSLAVSAVGLPEGSVVELVVGEVDHTGDDPSSVVAETLPASAFGRSGTASWTLPTPTSCFARVQVRTSLGRIVGIGNPVWMLREEPAGGIPEARRV